MNQYKTLFEQQSYNDALAYFQNVLDNPALPFWDYVILTASNAAQARAYEIQIMHRLKNGQIPDGAFMPAAGQLARVHYAVIPDENGQRVGSGGATLSCLKYVMEREHSFHNKRILVIHSGGDSKRIPQYSACGKLFSPVPRQLPDGRRSFLFDEFLIGMSAVPSRLPEGMLVCSGDVLLLFNALQIDFFHRKTDEWELGAAALSMKEKAETGKNHGVYLRDSEGNVGRFLHKQTVETLTADGALDSRGNVDIDTGVVILAPALLESLYSLIDTEEKYNAFVNEKARLSFYADFLYPLASGSDLEAYYREKPEGDFTGELKVCRTALWEVLHGYRMKLVRLAPASFIHFGTTRELLHLMTGWPDGRGGLAQYRFLGWKLDICANLEPEGFAASNSYISRRSTVGEGSYIEDSRIHRGSAVGRGCVVSGATLDGETVPDGSVLHVLKQDDGRFVCRMYGVADNPKEDRLFGRSLADLCRASGLYTGSLYADGLCTDGLCADNGSLWTARIYPVCGTVEEAVRATLDVIGALLAGQPLDAKYRKEDFISLKESFANADVTAILPWQENLYEQVVAEAVLDGIGCGVPAEEVKASWPVVNRHTVDYLLEKAEKLTVSNLEEFSRKIRIYAYLSKLMSGQHMAGSPFRGDIICEAGRGDISRALSDRCFETISAATLAACEDSIHYNESLRLVRDVTVELPVRVNWGGGWSDTPPYCMEHGGTVLNAAIRLNGRLPIEATVKRLSRPVIALASTDIGSYREFDSLEELQDCRNPSDPFALHKAALIACGVIPYKRRSVGQGSGSQKDDVGAGGKVVALESLTVSEICARLGSGFYMNTRVIDIPKGSGLGTSSILAGACVKALFEAFGVPISNQETFARVLCMEQLMSTGGGWQDQVGGIAPGIKMVSTRVGLSQKINCVQCSISKETMQELNERFALIYTGQRRLARNLLRDVVTRYVTNDRESLEAHYNIQQLAVLMRFELEKGNVDGFARLLTRHWDESQRIDAGSTNTCIDQIFHSIDDLIAGRMICGAGGGGFLQVVLKRGVSKAQLAERLNEVFEDSGVGVWDCEFV